MALETGEPERWWYLTTDHLGTPLVATDGAGEELWENRFEPFGRDMDEGTAASALASEMFLRFPGQWEDEVWQEATMGAEVYYNVHRWLQPTLGRYGRPDPLGILMVNGLRQPFGYAHAAPTVLSDALGLDAVTQDPGVQDCFYCLLVSSGFGTQSYEEAAWVTSDSSAQPPTYGCVLWPPTREHFRTTWPAGKPLPAGTMALAHTHPTRNLSGRRSQPEPSDSDIELSNRRRFPIYTISPGGIWKYDPGTGKTTKEESSNWTKGPKQRCEKEDRRPCEGFKE